MADLTQSTQFENVVLIIKNGSAEGWKSTDYRLSKGELGIAYLENGNVIVKAGKDGQTAWKDLPQVEGVFEENLILTHDFGKHKIPAAGFVDAGGKNMTTSQWITEALSEIRTPNITSPKVTLSGSASGHNEIGSYITSLTWTASFEDGQYEFGSTADNSSNTRKNTGITISDYVWNISNNQNTTTATSGTEKTTQNASVSANKVLKQTETGSFDISAVKLQVTQEASKNYATVTAKYTCPNTNARTPVNNVGLEVEGKIAAITEEQTLTANVAATSYRRPFWGVHTTPIDVSALTSDIVRGLSGKGTSNGGLPTTLDVPEGSRQVIFFAKAGVKSSMTATDSLAQNATVTFTKVANAVQVEGANGFEAVNYDMWYVQWGDPIASAKKLNITWA